LGRRLRCSGDGRGSRTGKSLHSERSAWPRLGRIRWMTLAAPTAVPHLDPISVVIPAHNEAATLGGCIDAMLQDAEDSELEIVVVCNGCTDATARVARGFGDRVRVIETDAASKPEALNLGDEEASFFPRFYVDADVRVSTEALRKVARVLRTREAHVAAPRLRLDLTGRSAAVRAYYAVWLRQPWATDRMVGSGVYALSEAGRRRFDRFPAEGADDTWVSGHFSMEERCAVPDVHFTAPASSSLCQIVRRRSRIFATNHLVAARLPHPKPSHSESTRVLLGTIMRDPALLPGSLLYAAVNLLAKGRASIMLRTGRIAWEGDRDQR
jgi:hypothetical protein